MKPTIAGAFANSPIIHWNEVLIQWCILVDRWCSISAPDRPWFHIEMPNAGLISAAATQCGHASLIESSVSKVGKNNGRSDLWVKFNQFSELSTLSSEDFVELKISPVFNERIDLAKYRESVREAIAVNWPCRAKIAACLFVVKPSDQGSDAYFQSMIEKVHAETQADAIAWSFPGAIREIPGTDRRFSPGVILALKYVGKQTSREYSSHIHAPDLEKWTS